jgi:YHS domain-containing protein
MKKIYSIALISGTFIISACGSNNNSQISTATNADSAVAMSTDTTAVISYDIALIDNKKDPTCGMPTSAGVSDTAHYDGKVLGFCAKECKDEFLKNPKASIAAAELK